MPSMCRSSDGTNTRVAITTHNITQNCERTCRRRCKHMLLWGTMGSIHMWWDSMAYSPLRGMNGICLFWMDGGSDDRECNERFQMAPLIRCPQNYCLVLQIQITFPPFYYLEALTTYLLSVTCRLYNWVKHSAFCSSRINAMAAGFSSVCHSIPFYI